MYYVRCSTKRPVRTQVLYQHVHRRGRFKFSQFYTECVNRHSCCNDVHCIGVTLLQGWRILEGESNFVPKQP